MPYQLIHSWDFGGQKRIVEGILSEELINATVDSIDWQSFNMITLGDEDFWVDVGGDLGDSGFSAGLHFRDDQKIIAAAPKSVEDLKGILNSFLKGTIERDYAWDSLEYKKAKSGLSKKLLRAVAIVFFLGAMLLTFLGRSGWFVDYETFRSLMWLAFIAIIIVENVQKLRKSQ